MIVVPLSMLIEQAVNGSDQHKRISGNVADVDVLLTETSLAALESAHDGYFAYLAFHPGVDAAVDAYLAEGSLPADSGDSVLVLYTYQAAGDSSAAMAVDVSTLVDLDDQGDLPSARAVQALFGAGAPALPGLVVVGTLSGTGDALYVELAGLGEAAAVRSALRDVFARGRSAWAAAGGDRPEFVRRLALTLQREGIAFRQSGNRSLLQWVHLLAQGAGAAFDRLVAVVGLVV